MRLLLAICLFLIASAAMLWTAAQAFEAAQKSRVTYKYIANALSPLPTSPDAVVWQAPEKKLVRPFSEVDAILIGRALREAWQLLAIAQETGAEALLSDRFTGVAKERALLSISDAQQFGGRMVVLSQTATPVFFHKDGSLFQTRIEMDVVRYLSDDGTALKTLHVTRDSGVATLSKESNGWRVLSWERRSSVPLESTHVAFSGRLVGLNYYPSQTPWRDFWPGFNASSIAKDLELIQRLNANSVRIFLSRDDFLGDASEGALTNLGTLLELAQEKKLTVVPTLFDLKQDFSLGTWADDALYLERVLPVLEASPAVGFIDVKNEPDLDFETHGPAKVKAWLQSMIALTRGMAPNKPLTIGWSNAESAETLINDLDVITYHDYADISGAQDRLAQLRQRAGGKPVYVTEIGESSFTLAAGFPGSEAAQADRLAERMEALKAADGVMVWTLFDFPKVDPTVIGSSPWVKRLQSSFGVLRADASDKRAAAVLRSWFAKNN